MYHSIEATCGTPAWPWSVSLQRFREQIDYLDSEGWSFCRLDDLTSNRSAGSKQVAITFDDAYADTMQAAEILVSRNLSASWFVVSNAMSGETTWSDEGTCRRKTLRPSQLRELVGSGMEIGGHSKTHRRLAEIDPAELDSETSQCKAEIEDALGMMITSYCYPYGSHNPAVVQSVRQAGFERACTTENGPASVETDRLRIRRLAVMADNTISEFARKIFLLNDDPGIRGFVRSVRQMTGDHSRSRL